MTPAKGGSCSRFSNLSYAFRRQPAHDALAGAAASRGRRDRRSTGTAGLCESRAEPAVVVERRCKNLPAYPEQSRAIYAYATPAELPEATSGAIGLRPAFCAKQPAVGAASARCARRHPPQVYQPSRILFHASGSDGGLDRAAAKLTRDGRDCSWLRCSP